MNKLILIIIIFELILFIIFIIGYLHFEKTHTEQKFDCYPNISGKVNFSIEK